MNCGNCGHPVKDGDKVCSACGTPLENPTPSAQIPCQNQQAAYSQSRYYAAQWQQAQEAAPVYYGQGEAGSGLGWITFLRVVLWIIFSLMLLSSLGAGFVLIGRGDGETILMGVGALVGGIFVSFLSVAAGMIALNNAKNLHKIANNSAKILDILQRK